MLFKVGVRTASPARAGMAHSMRAKVTSRVKDVVSVGMKSTVLVGGRSIDRAVRGAPPELCLPDAGRCVAGIYCRYTPAPPL